MALSITPNRGRNSDGDDVQLRHILGDFLILNIVPPSMLCLAFSAIRRFNMTLFLLRARSGDGPARQGDGLLSRTFRGRYPLSERTRGFKSPSPRRTTLWQRFHMGRYIESPKLISSVVENKGEGIYGHECAGS